MFRHRITAALLAIVCVGVLALTVPSVFAAPPPKPTLRVEYAVDSARVIATWAKSCDGKGCADSYAVKWTAGAFTRTVTKAITADTFKFPKPAFGDSLLATVTVTSFRRSIAGQSRTATTMVRNPDSPPPPVDSLKVDTIPRADSTKLLAFASSGAALNMAALQLTEFDSILFVQRKWFPPGTVRRDSTSYALDGLPSLRAHAIDRHGDSTWLVALACNCAESGSRTNPPRLDLRNGEWTTRDGAGVEIPVSPASADPFRR